MKSENKKILISIPVYDGRVDAEAVKSWMEMTIPSGIGFSVAPVVGYTVVQARNRIADMAVSGGYDYVMFLDSDIIVPQGALARLLNADKPIVGCPYLKKIEGSNVVEAIFIDDNGNPFQSDSGFLNGKNLVRAKGIGFGCVLVKTEVLKKFDHWKWFGYTEEHPADGNPVVESEDFKFCREAAEKGFETWIDATLRLGHIGRKVFW